MSKPRYIWWGYVKNMIREYPKGAKARLTEKEREAVEAAIRQTEHRRGGEERLKIVKLTLWHGGRVEDAARSIPCSRRTAVGWHGDFIRLVAECYGLIPPIGKNGD